MVSPKEKCEVGSLPWARSCPSFPQHSPKHATPLVLFHQAYRAALLRPVFSPWSWPLPGHTHSTAPFCCLCNTCHDQNRSTHVLMFTVSPCRRIQLYDSRVTSILPPIISSGIRRISRCVVMNQPECKLICYSRGYLYFKNTIMDVLWPRNTNSYF